MPKKIQSLGLNKNTFISMHKKIAENIKGVETSTTESIDRIYEISQAQSRVFLFGQSELNDCNLGAEDLNFVRENFPESFKGMNQFIEDSNLQWDQYTNFVMERLLHTKDYFQRIISEVAVSEIESEYQKVIDELESFLQEFYSSQLVNRLEEIENELKSYLESLYNSDSPDSEVIAQANEYLDQKQEEYTQEFVDTIQKELNDKAQLLGLAASVNIFNFQQPEQSAIDFIRNIFENGYASNIGAYFFNSLRRFKESVVDNVGGKKRSLATEQLESMSMNRNDYKLSIITHPRAYFRALIANNATNDMWKLVVPTDVELNPSGITAKHVYQIKTKDEWARLGSNNINVVDGMGLHHNSQEYYYPIFENEMEKEIQIAKAQRSEFLK